MGREEDDSPRIGEESERSELQLKIGRGWEMVATSRGSSLCENDISVFPPSNHEGLLVEETPLAAVEVKSVAISSPSRSSLSKDCGGSRWPVRFLPERERRGGNLVESVRRMIISSLEWLRNSSNNAKGGAIWPFGAVFGMAVLLIYSQRRCRREKLRLLLLVKEKDQTITRLSQHIAKINELMTSRLIIPVSRNA